MVDESGKQKKAMDWNKNVLSTTSNNECKEFFFNKKCLRYSNNRIQSKYHRIGTYEANKISLWSFNDKIYIQNNDYDELALGYQS